MAFKKGVVTNPKGRGTETEKQRKTASLLLSPHVEKAVARVARSLDSSDPEDHQWATNLIFSYFFPKPAQEVSVEGKEDISFKIVIGSND